jgi:dihydrodipicolinate reductase
LGEGEAERLAGANARAGRINVRRPIRGPVERSPSALADASSVRPEDLVATEQVFPGRAGESCRLAHRQWRRWCYGPRMTRDEVLLIKGWDSLAHGRARSAPQ